MYQYDKKDDSWLAKASKNEALWFFYKFLEKGKKKNVAIKKRKVLFHSILFVNRNLYENISIFDKF